MTRASKAIREARAGQIINEHPTWGRDKVNAELRKEYGVGLRKQTVDQLKRSITWISKPKEKRKPVRPPVAKDIMPLVYSNKIFESKSRKRYIPPSGHVLDNRPRALFVDIELVKQIFTKGRYTKIISVAFLGTWTRTKFMHIMTPRYFNQRVTEVTGEDYYAILGFWASKREER